MTAIQNTQAHSEFLTTSIPKQKPRLHKNYLSPLVNYPPCLTFRYSNSTENCKRPKNREGLLHFDSVLLGGNLATFNLALLILQKIISTYGFCFGIEVVKNSEGACVFCTVLIRGAKPPYNCNTKYTSPLRVFDNFNSKAKTIGTFNFSKN